MANKKITSIGISGILTLNTHDLNNQGSEGNITLERTATIVYRDEIVTVNAISGDMLKHSVAKYINTIAKEDKLPLCKGCMVDSANRINMEDKKKLRKDGKDSFASDEDKDDGKFSDAELSDKIIQLCTSDDLNGIMITEKVIGNLHRKGCYECGMIIGIPEKVNTKRDFHVKFSKEDEGESNDGSNKGQNIFHRPNSSGEYATVMFLDISHIGQNDYTYKSAISEEEKQKRFILLLKAVASSYVNFLGAQRNTMLPHVTDFKGIITISTSGQPAPTISPLNPNFIAETKVIMENFNKLSKDAISMKEFKSISEFTELMANLIA